jgi:hypothetical protein
MVDEQTSGEDPSRAQWRRSLAVEAFNGAWDLIASQLATVPGL